MARPLYGGGSHWDGCQDRFRFRGRRWSILVVAGLLPWVAEVLGSIPLPAKHLSSWGSGRIEHDHHHRGVVRSQLAHPPPLHGKVHQLLARVLPLVTSSPSAALQHVHLVVLLRRPHRVHRHLWTQHIPSSISPQDKTALLRDIDGVDMQVRLWGDNKDVLLAVVAPEVAQSPGNGQERDLINRGGAPDRPCVPELRSVPNNAGHSGLVHHLPSGRLDSRQLRLILWLVVLGESAIVPNIFVGLVLLPQHNSRVAGMPHKYLSPPYESNACSSASGGRQATIGLGPVGQVCPHVGLRLQEPIPDRLQHQVIVLRPEVLVLYNVVHQVLLCEHCRLLTPMSIKDTKEGVLKVHLVISLLVGHREHILHVLATTLVAMPSHPEVQPDAGSHGDLDGPLLLSSLLQKRFSNRDTGQKSYISTLLRSVIKLES